MREHDRYETPARDLGVLTLAVTVVFVAGYLLGVVVPYYVNDLDSYLLIDLVRSGKSPDEFWPSTAGPAGRVLHVVGFLTTVLSAIVLPVIAVVSLVGMVLGRHWRSALTCYLVALVLAVGTLTFQYTDFGRGLANWMLL